jgi:hypothetical protein
MTPGSGLFMTPPHSVVQNTAIGDDNQSKSPDAHLVDGPVVVQDAGRTPEEVDVDGPRVVVYGAVVI